jgi:Cutinase
VKAPIALILAATAIAASSVSAAFADRSASTTSPYDGSWTVTLTGTATDTGAALTGAPAQPCCAPFAFRVSNGVITSEFGSSGEPITGTITSNGVATITLNDVAMTSDPAFTNPVYFAQPCNFRAQFAASGNANGLGTVTCGASDQGGFGGSFSGTFHASRGSAPCGWLMLGSRGSGESLADAEGYGKPDFVFFGDLVSLLGLGNLTGDGLGASGVEVLKNSYPAISVPAALVTPITMRRYISSWRAGVARIDTEINQALTRCSTTKIVLAGYSQGADATASAYAGLTSAQRQQVVAVALFGDPRYDPRAEEDVTTPFQQNQQAGLTRFGILTHIYPKTFPARPFPPDAVDRVLSYCHPKDPVCQAQLAGTSQHLDYYQSNGDPLDAAKYFAGLLGTASP